MLIQDAFLTDEIRATDDYAEYEMVFMKVAVPMNQPQPIVSTQGTHRTTPKAHRTPTLTSGSLEGKKRKQGSGETSSPRKSLKVTIKQKPKITTIPPPGDDRERDEIDEATLLIQEKLAKEEIEKMVEGEEDEESYARTFVVSMLNDNVNDSGTRIEPESHMENLEVVDDDDVNDKEKQDEKKDDDDQPKDDDVEKMDDAAEEKDNDDHTNHILVGTHATGSMETRNEQMQTPILTPNRSPRKDLSSDKIIFEELTATILSGSIAGMRREVLDHCNNLVPELTFSKTNEMIKEEMPRMVNLAVQKDREIAPTNVPELIVKEFSTYGPKIIEQLFQKHMQNTTLNLYPTTSSSTAEMSTTDLQHQLYLTMKTQVADPELSENLKTKTADPLKGGETSEKLGIESYRININSTAPTLTFPGIEAYDPYLIVDKPDTGLIYLNKKDEKHVIYLVEIVKFCYARLEKVMNEVKRRIFQNNFWKKPPLLGELDLDIMKEFEREITKLLRHRGQLRMWESFEIMSLRAERHGNWIDDYKNTQSTDSRRKLRRSFPDGTIP
ncbi:hypothetical protein Tco_1292857 [Tanacetum coccineum]